MSYSKVFATFLLAAAPTAYGHGMMSFPEPRPFTDAWRERAYFGLRSQSDLDLQIAPIQLMLLADQADQPAADDFELEPCKGLPYDEGNPVAEYAYDTDLDMTYYVRAPHPGNMTLSVLQNDEQIGEVLRVDDFATSPTEATTINFQIPSTISGCDAPGDCVLQFYWHSEEAQQTYINCADFVMTGEAGAVPEEEGETDAGADEDEEVETPAVEAPEEEEAETPEDPYAASEDETEDDVDCGSDEDAAAPVVETPEETDVETETEDTETDPYASEDAAAPEVESPEEDTETAVETDTAVETTPAYC